ncbi:MAG TPA: OmpH family outer membrane protein [Sphingomicrobium sp.]
MKTYLIPAALAASMLAPAAANAQAVPGAVIAVVDLERVTSTCNACKTARTALQGQLTALQNREKTLAGPLETEGRSIKAAVDALKGKPVDATLQARADAWEQKRAQAAQELSRQQNQIQRNQGYITQQISAKLNPIYQQVMQRRGANILMEVGNTLATSTAVDVTNDVLTALNAALPSIQTTAPAQPPQQQPQGR